MANKRPRKVKFKYSARVDRIRFNGTHASVLYISRMRVQILQGAGDDAGQHAFRTRRAPDKPRRLRACGFENNSSFVLHIKNNTVWHAQGGGRFERTYNSRIVRDDSSEVSMSALYRASRKLCVVVCDPLLPYTRRSTVLSRSFTENNVAVVLFWRALTPTVPATGGGVFTVNPPCLSQDTWRMET